MTPRATCSTRLPWQVTVDDRSSCTCPGAISDRTKGCTTTYHTVRTFRVCIDRSSNGHPPRRSSKSSASIASRLLAGVDRD